MDENSPVIVVVHPYSSFVEQPVPKEIRRDSGVCCDFWGQLICAFLYVAIVAGFICGMIVLLTSI